MMRFPYNKQHHTQSRITITGYTVTIVLVGEGGVIVVSSELSEMILTSDSSLNDDTTGDTSIEIANDISDSVSSSSTNAQILPIEY